MNSSQQAIEEKVRLKRYRIIDMQNLFLNIENLDHFERYWNVYMQLHAYICSLVINTMQYK